MLVTLFVFTLVTTYVTANLPSYIHVCGRNDPNYNQCFVDNINNVKRKVCSGIPEFNIPPTEPLIIDKIVVYDTDNLKLSLQDYKLTGFCDFVVTSFYVSPEKHHFEFNFKMEDLKMDALYDIDIRLLVQLAHKGLIHAFTDDVKGKITVYLKEVTKNGKKQIYASRVNTIFDVESIEYDFDDSEKNLVQLLEIIRHFVNENKKEIVKIVTPVVERVVSNLVISIVNNVTYNRYEQLFPEETPKIV